MTSHSFGRFGRALRGRGRGGAVIRLTLLLVLVGSALAVPGLARSAQGASAAGKYIIGVSNTLVGNGWREEMICAVKAESLASGMVKQVVVNDLNNGSAADQIAGIRTLISAGANAIIINPSDPKALNPVIQQATQRGVVIVTVDQLVTSPLAYQAENDQVAYGRIGMEWLAKKLGGKGNVVQLRGIAGVPADTDRQTGVMQALAKYPGIKVVASVFTGWQAAPAAKQMIDLLNSGKKIDGVWTSGTDSSVVQAFDTAKRPYVPIVGADNNLFIHQLITLHSKGFEGAAVTNPATIGGVGTSIALSVLQGKKAPRIQKLTPAVWDYEHNLATLQAVYAPTQAPAYSVQWGIKGFTHYTQKQLFACKGP
jgi:ribose transport system substrate-binding protein